MDSTKETFIISIQKNLAQNDQPKQTRIKNSKSLLFFFLLIIFIIVTSSMLVPSLNLKYQRARRFDTMTLEPDSSQSIQLAIDELNSTMVSITKALSSISDSPLVGQRLSVCHKLVHHSLCRLKNLLGFDSDIESTTYREMDNLMAAMKYVEKCFLKLEEIDDMVVAVGGEEEKTMGVEEVKLGVEKAKKLIFNSIWLFDSGREFILDYFHRPFLEFDHDYSFDQNFLLGYKFLTGMYCLMYLVIAWLFSFLIWSGKK